MNEIRFTQAEMQKAMQYYLNEVVLKVPIKVLHVDFGSSGPQTNSFLIKTEDLATLEVSP